MVKAGTVTLETDRLILRRFTLNDAEDMYRNWASDPEVTKFLTWPTHQSVEVSKAVISQWLPLYEDGGHFSWAIELKEIRQAIGSIAVVKLMEDIGAANVGYCMGRAYWGRGIMPEALKAVMAYLFDTAGLNRVAAYHDSRNPKSGRVMAKAGMQWEGVLRQADRNNQGVCDMVWYAALRSEWKRG